MWPGDWGDEFGALPLWGRILIGCPCMLLVILAGILFVASVDRENNR